MLPVNIPEGTKDLISDIERKQNLGGAFVNALADRRYNFLRNQVDNNVFRQMFGEASVSEGENTAAWDGGNVFNEGLAQLNATLLSDFEASLADGDAHQREDFLYVASSHAFGRIRTAYGSQIEVPVVAPALGVSFNAVSVNGIPMLESAALPSRSAPVVASPIRIAVWIASVRSPIE